MSRARRYLSLLSILPWSSAFAIDLIIYTWNPYSTDVTFDNPANWTSTGSEGPPPTDGTAILNIGSSGSYVIMPAGNSDFDSLLLSRYGSYAFAYLETDSLASLSFANGITSSSPSSYSSVSFGTGVNIRLETDQTWSATSALVEGSINGPGKLIFSPTGPSYSSVFGSLVLQSANSFDGGLSVYNTHINLGGAGALGGSGPFTFSNVSLTTSDPLSFNNLVYLNSGISLSALGAATFDFNNTVTLLGNTVLNGNVTSSAPIYFRGSVNEDVGSIGSTLEIDSGSWVFSGYNVNGYTGGTYISGGKVIYRTRNAVPGTGVITSDPAAYVGAGFSVNIASFLAQLSSTNFKGTLGFDTLPGAEVSTNINGLDLSGVDQGFAGLGSTTSAQISGAITLGSNGEYRFGSGGGRLYVASPLDNASADVSVSAPYGVDPVLVLLQGTNTFGGNIVLSHGALVLDGANALPSGTAIHALGEQSAYIGATESTGLSFSDVLNRIGYFGSGTVVGVDSHVLSNTRTVSDPIDLSRSGTITSPYFLGTSSKVNLTGTITPATANGSIYLTGAFGGSLTIGSPLDSNIGDVYIGAETPMGSPSTVALTQANSHSGDTKLNSGTLALGNNNALSTGKLIVEGNYTTFRELVPLTDLTLSNDIVIGQFVSIGNASTTANLTLAGAVYGSSYANSLAFRGNSDLTFTNWVNNLDFDLSGSSNSLVRFNGSISDSSINLNSGSLAFVTGTNSLKSITTAAGTTTEIAAGAVLEINSGYGEGYGSGEFNGLISGDGALNFKDSNGYLALNHANTFTGGVTVRGASISVNDDQSLGSGTLTVLATDSSYNTSTLESTDPRTLTNAIQLDGALTVTSSNDISLNGPISGSGSLRTSGTGTLSLGAANTFTGDLSIVGGSLIISDNNGAGTGMLQFLSGYGTSNVYFQSDAPVIHGLNGLDVTSTLNLADNSTLHLQIDNPSYYAGIISGDGARILQTGSDIFYFSGSLLTTAGYRIEHGATLFSSYGSLSNLDGSSSNALSVGANGYAGFALDGESFSQFLSSFDPTTTTGSIGIDSIGYREGYLNQTIDLSSFAPSVRLGSATHARLGAATTIIPAGDTNSPYRFGGGGGFLDVESVLSGDRDVVGDSPIAAPLSVILTGANTFTGNVSATQTSLIFAPGALPSTAHFSLGTGGYISTADSAMSLASFIARFDPASTEGMIGFDRVQNDESTRYRILTSPIVLTAFTGVEVPFIGTSSGLVIRGPITLPSGVSLLRLGAQKGGTLVVSSQLGDTITSVQIGDPSSLATFGDPTTQELSTVELRGNNTYSGATSLYAGRLLVTGDGTLSSLGTGPLQVEPHQLGSEFDHLYPALGSANATAVISNQIVLNTNLDLDSYYGTLLLNGDIIGSGGLIISGENAVQLSGNNSYTGGTAVDSGELRLGSDTALGTGPLVLSTETSGNEYEYGNHNVDLYTINGPRTLANNVTVFGGGNTTINGSDLILNGDLRFDSSFIYLEINNDVYANGPIIGSGYLSLAGSGRLWITDGTQFTGDLSLQSGGRIILRDVNAVNPDLTTNGGLGYGYTGLASVPGDLQTEFIDLFDRQSYNTTIGFDTVPGSPTNLFTGTIDLTDFQNTVYLGTASNATISATVTPNFDNYAFGGNSKGWLDFTSDLVDDTLNEHTRTASFGGYDYNAPFIIRLSGNNSYSGSTWIDRAAVIFGSDTSLSPNTSIDMSEDGGYAGVQASGITFAQLVSTIDPTQRNALLGVDTGDLASPRVLSSPDLSHFNAGSYPNIGLGTATAALINGTITLPVEQSSYRFFAYGGGTVTVDAILSDSNVDLQIGDSNFPTTLGDLGLGMPTVRLTANNTFGGNTYFNGGQLEVAHSNALSSGFLFVSGNSDGIDHVLRIDTASLANAIFLNADLEIQSSLSAIALSGVISGYNQTIGLNSPVELTLSGVNTLNYGHYIVADGSLNFASEQSVGSQNTLSFVNNGGSVTFNGGRSSLDGLTSEGAPATVNIGTGATLALNITENSQFNGTITGPGALDKEGAATLVLGGDNTYAGGTTISGGLLIAGHPNAFGTGAVTLNGGQLSVNNGVTFNNPFNFGASGGRLAGNGTFNGPVSLGSNSGLAPGNSVGSLTFNDTLTWTSGAFFDFEVEDALGAAGTGYDTVYVANSLNLTATALDPFTVNLLTIAGTNGPTLVFDNSLYYTWTLASAGSIIGFDPTAFKLDSTGFNVDLGTGNFYITSNNTQLLINFQPVPEPSTLALLGLGLTLLAGSRRRRRQTPLHR